MEMRARVARENTFMWKKEFEDCFENSIIAKAFAHLGKVENFPLKVSESELQEARQSGKSVTTVLSRIAYEVTGRGLNKPELGRIIAELAGKENADSLPQDALSAINNSLTKA